MIETLCEFFLKYVLEEGGSDEAKTFLRSILESHFEGHLCFFSENPPPLPKTVISFADKNDPRTPIVREENRFYLRRNWEIETALLKEIRRIMTTPFRIEENREIFLRGLEKSSLSESQKEAVKKAFDMPLSLLFGGPGSGKTFSAASFARLLLEARGTSSLKILLAAPTGKAASQLKKTLGLDVEAMTLHRLLGVGRKNPSTLAIDAHFVIVDEASMINGELLLKLFQAIRKNTRLMLLGDVDQLPPVESGSVFKECKKLFGLPLSGSIRVENQKLFPLFAKIQKEGVIDPAFLLPSWTRENFFENLFSRLPLFLHDERPDPEKALRELERFRILSMLKKGPFGSDQINLAIEKMLEKKIRKGQWWSIPIMITSNDPEEDLYNGSSGVLIGRCEKGLDWKRSEAFFPKKFDFSDLPPFSLAFCLSVHKSQGSEYDSVLAIFPEGSERFGREALYTAVTRAKKEVKIVGKKSTLREMLQKKETSYSGLFARMKLIPN